MFQVVTLSNLLPVMLSTPDCHAERSEASLYIQSRHFCQRFVYKSEVFPRKAHRTGRSEKLIADSSRWQWYIEFPPQFECQQHILLHHIDIKQGFSRRLEYEWGAILQRRRSNDAI